MAQPALSAPASSTAPIGVLLVNLGTPDFPSYFAVQRFLREFLSDPRVIDTSRWLWYPLLYGIVLPLRPLKILRNYRRIWMQGGSPLAIYSSRLTAKVQALLAARCGDARVVLGMTYGNPRLTEAVESLLEQNVARLVVLPLYPQNCSSTTGSVFDGVNRALQRTRALPEVRFINGYCEEPDYLDLVAHSIREHWADVGEKSHLVLSYHGIPLEYVRQGDPYRDQSEATTRGIVSRLGLSPAQYSHCYQSRFGPVAWLEPYTEPTLKALVGRGVRKVTVVSPSFAVDCLETLEEVAVEYREKFAGFGGERLTLVPSLNDGDAHARMLAGIVARRMQGWV